MSLVRLGLLAFSAGVAALVVAIVMPYTEPEVLAAIAAHPIGGKAANASTALIRGFARLLIGAPAATSGPNLLPYYPLPVTPPAGVPGSNPPSGTAADAGLDWGDPEVWRLQQQQVREPYYTDYEMAKLLYWCNDDSGSSGGSGSGDTMEEAEAAAASASRFGRLAEWVSHNGGDVSRVALGSDGSGFRGLHATQAIAAGEVALSVPLKMGLSAATFRAARMLSPTTSSWRTVEDSDMFLDALALSYEVAVHGERSPWANYICLLPRKYDGLPVHASDPGDAAMLSELPALRRLAAKRRAQLALFGNDLAQPTLEMLPGGRAAMSRLRDSADGDGGRSLWQPLWHWAYAAAKTRSVTLGAEELRAGGGGAPSGEGLGLPLRLPMAMLEWVQELGVLLPVLDLANHAFDRQGANVAYQLLADSTGTGLTASLVATSYIAPGQAILFDYVASAETEQGPACLDRWLLEYGFVPDMSSDPRRDCDTFEITAADAARALRATAAAVTAAAAAAAGDSGTEQCGPDAEALEALEARVRARLARMADAGMPDRLVVHVRQPDPDGEESDFVTQRWAVARWLGAALQGEGRGPGGGGGGGAAGVDARGVLRAVLQARWEQLGQLEERAGAAGAGAGSRELRRGLVVVAAAGRRAVERALAQELGRS